MQKDSILIDEIAGMLMDSTLFSSFAPAEVRSIARYFGINNIDGDGVIFEEGDIGNFMCIVNSGKVSILKANQDGENVEVATLIRDRTFGEMAVLDGERRSATCIAATDCVLLTLSKDSLDRMLEETPRNAAKVIRAVAVALSKRLRMADGKLVDYQI
ncbi:MAG: cyclic nucleotide-binding domain-containing protein [Gallionellaceae bacterium]|nr:cyclic nucleotide-binding domain-containing protein [Gallionellaceae bacterium]